MAGTPRIQWIIDGVRTGGLIAAGNFINVKPDLGAERIDLISRQKETRRQAIDGMTNTGPMKLSITANTFFLAIIEMMLLGLVTELDSASIVAEPFTVPVVDEWVPFGDLEAFPAHTLDDLTDDEETPGALVEGTDYEYRQVDGSIKILSTGSVVVSDIVLGDLTTPAEGYSIAISKDTEKKIRLLIDGVNEFNGRDCFFQAHRLAITPEDIADLVEGGEGQVQFMATAEVPEGFSEPAIFQYKD
jgi:hypothetical protein